MTFFIAPVERSDNWNRENAFSKFWIDNFIVESGTDSLTFRLDVTGFNHTNGTYTIERFQGQGFQVIDSGTYDIKHGGKCSITKTIDLRRSHLQNSQIHPTVLA
ncbi:hypothetical protein KK062_26165 [Fulvivirgaceae bacterium PWU5]|uniref:Uncharacterized protein n=1 Tax=Dawidia cretensis TaxID=2782350 RepID=A0AAP2E4S2_9BACT|nr:hypothetical protein [Dawidia cretensis]MBT1711754.1 hypothetical protein [Dawidia cretensis]